MADAEQDLREQGSAAGSDTRCTCGSTRFVLEAYLEVDSGTVNPEPIDMEALTCPECGREYEAVLAANGRMLRGEFRGYFEDDEA